MQPKNKFSLPSRLPAIVCLLTFFCALAYPQDLAKAISGLERRYASAETVSGNFEQTYRAPGIDQVQSGVFWLKKPGLMLLNSTWYVLHPGLISGLITRRWENGGLRNQTGPLRLLPE